MVLALEMVLPAHAWGVSAMPEELFEVLNHRSSPGMSKAGGEGEGSELINSS